MKERYENTLEDRNFLEVQLKKAKKVNKLLYLKQFDQTYKNLNSDSSLASLIKNDLIEDTDKSSTEKLMVTREEISLSKKALSSRRNLKSFNIDQEVVKATPFSLKSARSITSGSSNRKIKWPELNKAKSDLSANANKEYRINTFLVDKSQTINSQVKIEHPNTSKHGNKLSKGSIKILGLDSSPMKHKRSNSNIIMNNDVNRIIQSRQVNRNHMKF